MGLQAGDHLGIYEIVSPLGAGGMGEVYRARDTKLGRDVALKVLPEAMAQDPQRMARFEREARTLASLNHPNIAAIHGLEESGGTGALVMELVEGETLEERIARSSSARASMSGSSPRLQPEECLNIARQIAEALEYAHERGVVHRDLKPANVKITPEGTVKVLDFGLAKVLTGGDSASSMDPSNSPTLSVMATQMGIILGTAAYMAPEQAKGKQVDRRADIWAFGCVLYEVFAGRKAFEGETITDVLAAVVRADPDWDALPNTTPPAAQRLIRRCLQKDPKLRLQAIGEARILMDATLAGTDAGTEMHAGRAATTKQTSRLRRMLPWGVAALCLLSTILTFLYFRLSAPAAPTTRALIMAPEKMQFGFSNPDGAPILSPDGKRLVFPIDDQTGNSSLWVRPLNSLTAQQLQGTEGAAFPFWAPDSRQLGFFKDGKLEKIDVTGGPPVLICDATNGRGGTWSRDGVIVFAPEVMGGLSSVPAAGGTPTAVLPAPKQGKTGARSDRWPEFLPDGKHFLYLGGNDFAPGTKKLGIYVGKLGSKETKFLLQADSQALYAAPGYLLFLRGNTLMAQRFDAGSVKLGGEAFPVAENIPSPQSYRLGLFGVSETGVLVYTTSIKSNLGDGQLEWVDATGKELGKVGPAGAVFPRLSPDGKRLAYVAGNSESIYGDMRLLDLTRGVNTRFTFISAEHYTPVWSPDGLRIAYGADSQNSSGILVKDASGAGKPKTLLKTQLTSYPTDWSRDGRYVLYSGLAAQGKGRFSLWVLPQFGDHKPFPYLQDKFTEMWSEFSPDGHWVAYQSDESGKLEVYLSTFPAGGGKWQVSQDGGQFPVFSRDGRELYYVAAGGRMMEASVKEKGSSVEIGTPHQVFELSKLSISPFDVAPDGKRFLVVESAQGASPPLTLVINWGADLKK